MILSIQESVMKKSKHSEQTIIRSIKQSESGIPVKDICRELGISTALFYQGRSKYSGMEASDLKRLKDLEEENRRLKQMYADLSIDNALMKELIEKKL
jgi:putative transposase